MRLYRPGLFFVWCIFCMQASYSAAQEVADRQSFGVSSSFAPSSSHILIGRSEQRRVWTLGFEYARKVIANDYLRLDYVGTVTPLFLERDPTETGQIAVLPDGTSLIFPTGTVRVVSVRGPIGYLGGTGGSAVPLYPITHGTQETYAASISPLGARISGFTRHRLQPTFSGDLGLVLSARDLPIDNSARLNFLYSFGPGAEFFYRERDAVRIEYLYRHMSNANTGQSNPGVDAGVFRLTFSRRHK